MRHIAFRWVMAVFIVIGSGLGVWQGGQMSPPHAFAAGTLAIDQLGTTHQTSAGTGISSPTFTTTQTGELLIAFVTSDGPYPGVQTFSSMTGGGLAWRLRKRTNTQAGTAEIWQAVAQNVLTNATVTATRASGGFLGSITVATFTGASTTVDGATGGANASTGAPSASLVTTKPGSWVWAVGDDWDQALARTVGANQTKVDEFLASSGDTFWVQRATALTSLSGATVTINDTAPTSDRWNMSLIEIPSAAVDTTPPTAPTNLVGTATGPTTVSLNWGAATDNTAVTGYSVLRGGTQIGTSTTLAYTDTSVLATTTYTYTVQAYDAAGNFGPTSNVVTVTTPAPAPDTTPPTVSITGPITGATVSGSVSVTANASDNIGVAGVQFTLDGGSLGAEVTTSPYAVQWDTATASNGSHTLVAVARDAAGNTTTAKSVTVTVSNSAGNQATVGQWGPVVTWPEVSIHAALTPSGKILTFQGDFTQGGQQYLLNPTTGTYIQVPNAAADLFCAGQAVTADGRILVIGGTATSGGLGIKAITAFDSTTETWQNLAPMHYPRWYATGTTLGDGRVFVTSGDNQNSTDVVPIPEMYDVLHNTWSDLPGASNAMPIYPFIYQLPDGRILHAGGSEVPTATEVLNLATQTWTTIDARIIDGASIANYAPGKFIKAGSATDSGKTGPSTNTAFTLDMNQPNPTWQPTTSMQYPRSFVNLTNLPDGTVLATGGGTEKSGYNDANAVLPAEVWNPATGTWKTVAALTAPRLYHSVAVLLPDGRVFVSGSGGDPGVGDQKNYQIYSPSYLFKGPRPTITSAPSTVRYNSSQFIGTPDAAGITSVTLIRTGSVTHSFDQNARSMSLNFTQTAGGLNVQMPVNGNTAPPGYYLLSIVNSQGVPSVSSYVRFAAPYEDSIAPTAPASLTANGAIGSASLTWTAATDNVGVTAYDVYRSTTPGFTATSSNKIGQVVGNTLAYTDTAVTAGTYYYQVRAEDAAGNIGPSSNEASANVLSDTTPPSAPGSLVASASGTQTVNLSWGAATDNVAVSRYNVLRNGAQIGTTPGLTYADNTVSASTTYTYTVTAQDAAGNVGPPSNAVNITVNPAPAV
ncbi:MAG: hypothetical protein JWO42_1480, partial [Chloroflexi bacterium]|nr:hypothetical protein [Chloroflexota bacterium]